MLSSWAVRKQWSNLFVLIGVSLSGSLLYFLKRPAWWPLIIALIPIGLALSAGHFPFKRARFDWAVGVFGFTALLGVWAAYDQAGALHKFLIIAASILLCYAVAAQKEGGEQLIGFFLICLGCVISAVFLLAHDWQTQAADYEWINRLGRSWAAVRPQVIAWPSAPNKVGGILATLFPYTIALAISNSPFSTHASRRWGLGTLALLACSLIAMGLLMSSSRGAWLSLTLAFVLWLVLIVYSRIQARSRPLAKWIVRVSLIFLGAAITIVILSQFQTLIYWFDRLPGLASGHSRAEIAANSLRLVQDFPFSGGGLGSFPGLYSQYIQSIPFYLYGYSHNFYLDVAIEQGVIGLGSLVLILFISLFIAIHQVKREALTESSVSLLRHATLIALITMILHGFVDDAFYGEKGTPLLFLFPGLTIYLNGGSFGFSGINLSLRRHQRSALAIIALTVFSLMLFLPKANSYWHSNLAAVRMAKFQLTDFPGGRWKIGAEGGGWDSVERLLLQAFNQNNQNRPAAYRLGLIALMRMDFVKAADFLTIAYHIDPGHRGVVKNLGYCYVWLNQPDQALPLLQEIPEAQQELEAYTGWWRLQGRPELAEKAALMLKRLQ
ncbi:MAG: O-antigen ligase family protein [Anaerolineales bacterium]|nr:O-antigen ligase family protein [Anaerolineales bacterium]